MRPISAKPNIGGQNQLGGLMAAQYNPNDLAGGNSLNHYPSLQGISCAQNAV